jgi:hypothetical protein
MTTRQTLYALAGIAITLGTTRLTAGENIAPYYDEESDTVVYNFVGGPVPSVESQASVPAEDRAYPYYDADTDTVVYHFTGDTVTPSRPGASMPAASRFTPYYDEDTDTVVYRHVGHQATRRTAMMSAP